MISSFLRPLKIIRAYNLDDCLIFEIITGYSKNPFLFLLKLHTIGIKNRFILINNKKNIMLDVYNHIKIIKIINSIFWKKNLI